MGGVNPESNDDDMKTFRLALDIILSINELPVHTPGQVLYVLYIRTCTDIREIGC